MTSPAYDSEDSKKNTGRIIPLYQTTYGLPQNTIRTIIENGLKDAGKIDDTFPEYILKSQNLLGLNDAVHQIHFPEDFSKFKEARRRLAFEELFSMQIALLSLKNEYNKEEKGIAFSRTTVLANRLKAALVLIPNSLQRESNCSLISESRRIEIAVVDMIVFVLISQR